MANRPITEEAKVEKRLVFKVKAAYSDEEEVVDYYGADMEVVWDLVEGGECDEGRFIPDQEDLKFGYPGRHECIYKQDSGVYQINWEDSRVVALYELIEELPNEYDQYVPDEVRNRYKGLEVRWGFYLKPIEFNQELAMRIRKGIKWCQEDTGPGKMCGTCLEIEFEDGGSSNYWNQLAI